MTNCHVVADDTSKIVGDMANAQVLDICMMTDDDPIDIAAQHGTKPDARLFADGHIANQLRAGR